MNILLDNFSQSTPQNDIMPIRMVWHLGSILKRIATLCCCHTETSHRHTLIYIAHLRLLADISYKHYLIHASCPLAFPK